MARAWRVQYFRLDAGSVLDQALYPEILEFDFVLVLTTLPADADAGAFARALVEDRLAACVNMSVAAAHWMVIVSLPVAVTVVTPLNAGAVLSLMYVT